MLIHITLEGKKKYLSLEHFQYLGAILELNEKQIKNVFKRFEKFKPLAEKWIKRSFLSEEFQEKYIELMTVRYRILYPKT